jgi:hypothetical protein
MEVNKQPETERVESTEQQKLFTQDDVNQLLGKEISKLKQKFIDQQEAEKLKNETLSYKTKYETLTKSIKTKELKDTFVKNGGVAERFDDFSKLNGDIFNANSDEYDNLIKQKIEKQPYFFFDNVEKQKTKDQISDDEVLKFPRHFPFNKK